MQLLRWNCHDIEFALQYIKPFAIFTITHLHVDDLVKVLLNTLTHDTNNCETQPWNYETCALRGECYYCFICQTMAQHASGSL